jgi:hypothetical protein
MRARKWIAVVAVLSVLVHAGALVRHGAAMTGATFQHQALVDGLAQLCRGGGTGETQPAPGLPYVPGPPDAQNGCPVCSGLSPAFALASPDGAALRILPPETVPLRADGDRAVAPRRAVRPLPRAPPAAAA